MSADPNDVFLVPPFVTPSASTDRINFLLTGVDLAEERSHAVTDTLIVASINPTTRAVALISFPRAIASDFPLVDGGTYHREDQLVHDRRREPPGDLQGQTAGRARAGVGLSRRVRQSTTTRRSTSPDSEGSSMWPAASPSPTSWRSTTRATTGSTGGRVQTLGWAPRARRRRCACFRPLSVDSGR